MPTLFNGCGSGPPLPFTATSAWTWIGHPVSGLHAQTSRPIKTRFPSGSAPEVLNHACTHNSPDRSTKSTRLHSCGAPTACKHRVSGSLSLPSRGSFHLSFTVLCSIGHQAVFRVTGWSPRLPPGFLVSRCTLDPAASFRSFAYGAFTLSGRPSQSLSAGTSGRFRGPYPGMHCIPVCPPSISLAATPEIDVSFLSSPYLDVSVRAVPLRALWIRARMAGSSPAGFPHSDTRGSRIICISPRLFAACRVFLRLLVPGHPPCALFCLTVLPP